MPSVQSSNRHPRIMAISPWSIPFFITKKGGGKFPTRGQRRNQLYSHTSHHLQMEHHHWRWRALMGMSSSQPSQCWIRVPCVAIWNEGEDSADKGGTRTGADDTSTKSCGRFGPKLPTLATTHTAPESPSSCPNTSPVQTATMLATIR